VGFDAFVARTGVVAGCADGALLDAPRLSRAAA